MDAANDNAPLEPRLPDTDDLVFLCRCLNEAGAKYLVVVGFAIIQHGFVRATEDVDLLIDVSPDNFGKVQRAMMALPDGAIREVTAQDLQDCLVVRVADEFVVDLMRQACGIEYAEACQDAVVMPLQGGANSFRLTSHVAANESDLSFQGCARPGIPANAVA